MTSDTATLTEQRHVFLGTQRFVGNLYNRNVLRVEEVLWTCEALLDQTQLLSDDNDSIIQPIPLEALCILLATCGQTLEGTVTSFATLQTCWSILQAMIEDESEQISHRLSFRMRHIVRELLELRATAWQPVRYGARCRQELVARPLVVVSMHQDRMQQPRHKKKNKYRGVRFVTTHQRNDNCQKESSDTK